MSAVHTTSAFWLISLILGAAALHGAQVYSSVGSGFRSALHAASTTCTASHAVGYHAHVHSAQTSLPVICNGSELLLTCQRAWPLPLRSIPSGAVCFALPWRQRLDAASFVLAGSRLSRCLRLRPDAGQAPEHRGVEEPERGMPRTVTPSLMRVAQLKSHGDRHRLRGRPALSPRDRRLPLQSTCRELPLPWKIDTHCSGYDLICAHWARHHLAGSPRQLAAADSAAHPLRLSYHYNQCWAHGGYPTSATYPGNLCLPGALRCGGRGRLYAEEWCHFRCPPSTQCFGGRLIVFRFLGPS